jgi:TolA-binding protein
MGKLERTRRGASFTSLFASAARPTPTDPRIILMALRHDADDASLSRIADDLIGVRELLERIDHAQDALLQNGQSLQGQLEALTGQITHMIQVLTPERPEQEGPSLADLLARILTQQSGMTALLRQINDTLTRLTPAEAATAHANTPVNGAGHA